MNTQEVYDTIHEFFSRPGAQLAKGFDSNKCWYRGPNGCRCPAGVVIPDSLYDPWMEDKSFYGVTLEFDSLFKMFSDETRCFIEEAQDAHDSTSTQTVEVFIEKLNTLAKGSNLQVRG